MSKLTEKKLSREEIFKGHVVHLVVDRVELENGHETSREVVEHPGGVCVAALTEKNELLFVRQFRYPYGEVVLELPAGKLEKGSTPLENGKRELKEETGATGYTSEIIHLYFCRVGNFGEMEPDDDEFLEVERIPLEKAVEMVLNNEIPDSKTQTAVLKTAMLLEKGIL